MANAVERSCTMLVYNDKQASASEIREALEGNDPLAKQAAMKKAVSLLLAGEQLPALFITIVRYVLPSEDHMVQKLLLLYLVSRLDRRAWDAARQGQRGKELNGRATADPGRESRGLARQSFCG